MQNPNIPEVGKTYFSKELNLTVTVTDIHNADPIEDDESSEFLVECCKPGDENDMLALGHSFIESEWNEYGFSPVCA